MQIFWALHYDRLTNLQDEKFQGIESKKILDGRLEAEPIYYYVN